MPNGLRDLRLESKSPQELYDEKYFVKDAVPPQPQAAATPVSQKSSFLGAPQPSPTSSFSSASPSVKEEKKKKNWLSRLV